MGLRRIFAIAATLTVVMLAGVAATGAAERFFAGIEDLPVMPGLEQMRDAGVSFDKPEGRIVEVAASGKVSRRAVVEFYRAVLPQLGWRAAGRGRYRREGEHLNLSFSASGSASDSAPGPTLTVRFSLRPD